ncbi:MAG: FecR domain-containing protein [Marinoscillum sp.]
MNQNDDTFLARWLNDELTPEERSDFESSPEYADFQKIVLGVESMQSAQVDLEGIKQRIEKAKLKSNGKTIWWYAAAACITLLIGFYSFTQWTTNVKSGFGEQLAYNLPDGSSVLLNAKSQLSLQKWGWEDDRTLDLKGEAYFDVAKGSAFTVKTDLGNVTVLGTEFNVLVADGLMEVTCYEGKVKVNIGHSESTLTVGQRVTLVSDKYSRSSVGVNEPGWKSGVSAFSSIPVKYVIESLKNQFEVEINNTEKINLEQPFTGQFPHDDLSVALSVVFEPLNIKYQIEGEQVYLEPM